MLAAIRAARNKDVIEVLRLGLQNADLAGRKNLVHIVAGWVRYNWPGDVVKSGLCGRRSRPGDGITHPGPCEAVIIRALDTDQ